jgi:DNA-binding NtrC family response regulator
LHRILVVDDEPDILEALEVGLQSFLGLPVEVVAAVSPTEARRQLGGKPFDMVIADEKMPGESGSQLLAWVRGAQPRVTRVLMTAYAPESVDAANAAPQLVLRKPFDLATLVPAVRSALPPVAGGRPRT